MAYGFRYSLQDVRPSDDSPGEEISGRKKQHKYVRRDGYMIISWE